MSTERKFKLSLFRHAKDNKPHPHAAPWPAIVTKFMGTPFRVSLSLARAALQDKEAHTLELETAKKKCPAFSPATFDGTRQA